MSRHDMDELEIATMVGQLLRQIEAVLETGMLQPNAQIVVRPIWPNGKLSLWVVVNWPN
ncbi:MAG TPA: hypothetical protein VIE44_03500 [Methylomirabilota bacterium]